MVPFTFLIGVRHLQIGVRLNCPWDVLVSLLRCLIYGHFLLGIFHPAVGVSPTFLFNVCFKSTIYNRSSELPTGHPGYLRNQNPNVYSKKNRRCFFFPHQEDCT